MNLRISILCAVLVIPTTWTSRAQEAIPAMGNRDHWQPYLDGDVEMGEAAVDLVRAASSN